MVDDFSVPLFFSQPWQLKKGSLGKETVAAYSGKNFNVTKLIFFAY